MHFSFDAELARNQAATIAGLGRARYANTLSLFNEGLAALSKAPPDGKAAIRATFAAVEGLFRLMFTDAPRLTNKECDRLRPKFQSLYANDPAPLGASHKTLRSLQEWVDAAHFYRHEAGREDAAQPPLEMAVQLCSAGAGHLRWLAHIDTAIA